MNTLTEILEQHPNFQSVGEDSHDGDFVELLQGLFGYGQTVLDLGEDLCFLGASRSGRIPTALLATLRTPENDKTNKNR